MEGRENTYIDFAAILTAVINFLIVAAVVYFVIVLPLNALKARRKRGEESGPAEPTDVELLVQIRDLLAEGRNGVAAGRHTTAGDGRLGGRRRPQRRAAGLTGPPTSGRQPPWCGGRLARSQSSPAAGGSSGRRAARRG